MTKIRFSGPIATRASSFLALNRCAIETYLMRSIGKRLEPSWSADIEIGIRFWRHQFTEAMNTHDPIKARAIFDSLQTETDDIYDVVTENQQVPKGTWYKPKHKTSTATVLYLHGGGYAFNGPVSARFAAMFAHHTGADLFALHYRLTPEHPHPAQAQDALAAWEYIRCQTPADQIVVMGDSAGGHMALMLLQTLCEKGLEQPALCIGLCPWTDIGERGESLHGNDKFDLVQGWMVLQFGRWLDPDQAFGGDVLSPVSYDYSALAPLYLQAGGREILRDMIKDFAMVQHEKGAQVMLDLWPDMPHNFHAYDSLRLSSTQALERVRLAVETATSKGNLPQPIKEVTVLPRCAVSRAPLQKDSVQDVTCATDRRCGAMIS